MATFKISWTERTLGWMYLEAEDEADALERFNSGRYSRKEDDSIDTEPAFEPKTNVKVKRQKDD